MVHLSWEEIQMKQKVSKIPVNGTSIWYNEQDT